MGPRILVGTLYSGENERGIQLKTLGEQSYRDFSHEVIEFLPKAEAHSRLFGRFEDAGRDGFTLALKLDGDMTLRRDSSLSGVVEVFSRYEELSHAVFSVFDFPSQSCITGIHAFRIGAVRWPRNSDVLYTDPNPIVKGDRWTIWGEPSPIADHMISPSLEQAFLLGYHRALKIRQFGRLVRETSNAQFQMQYIEKIWSIYRQSRDDIREAVLWGAEFAFEYPTGEYKKDSQLAAAALAERSALSAKARFHLLESRWAHASGTRLLRQAAYCEVPRVWSPTARKFRSAMKRLRLLRQP